MSDSASEAFIQRDIELAIGAEPDVLLLKNSVGRAVFIDEKTGRKYTVPFGLGVGSPDLVSILRTPLGLGIWFCIEVKREGEEPRAEQQKSHQQWRAFGALIYVAHSVAEARAALHDARLVIERAIRRERRSA